MGHADVSTTMNIYAEANPEVTREALEKLAKNMDVFQKQQYNIEKGPLI